VRDFSATRIKIARIADRQFGHVTRQQLLELSLPSATIANWAGRNGRLITVHAGVYAVGHAQHSPQALAMAAVLACGPGHLTIRLTTARLINNPAHEAARLRRILERRRLQAA
jgi:hypothetical protein